MGTPTGLQQRPTGLRYYGGWFFFILSFVLPFLSPLLALPGFDKATTGILMGAMIVGIPELIMLIAIALWGKATFDYFMGPLAALFKRVALPKTVSATRYYFGLVLLLSSFIPSWIIAYLPTLLSNSVRIYIVLTFDIVFVLSFFVLGGDFWEKVRAIFIPAPIRILDL